MSTNPSTLFLEEKKGQHVYHNVWGGDDLHIGIYRPKSLSLFEANRKTTERMIRLLPKIKRASRVLVIQSGFGGAARFIAETYKCKVWCLNDDEKQNEYNERRIEEVGLSKSVKVAKGFVEYMPYDPDYFDFVIGQDALSLTGKKRETFRAIHRVLKPEGRLIISALMRSESCEDDESEKLIKQLPLEELITEEQYGSDAKRGFLQQIYSIELSDQLVHHYTKVLYTLQANKEKLVEQSSERFVQDRIKTYKTFIRLAEDGCLDWGILMFQKMNG